MLLSELTVILQGLVGCHVASKNIAGNSIFVWFGADKEKGIYVDPPWRLVSAVSLETSSAEFPWDRGNDESEDVFRRRFDEICSKTDAIQGSKLVAVVVNQKTSDLQLTFEGDLQLQSFTVWFDESNWKYIDHAAKKRYAVSLSCIEITTIDA